MPSSKGIMKPLVSVNRSSELYNNVNYPVGGNVTTSAGALFNATFLSGSNVINVTYLTLGQIVPDMIITGIGVPSGTTITGPFNQGGTGRGGTGSYVISNNTTSASTAPGNSFTGTASPLAPSGPGGVIGPVLGFNCVNINDIRRYYDIPYPPKNKTVSPPVIAVVSFGGGIYGQPVTTGKYAGFWKCSDISEANGTPIQILVNPINGAINAPNSDDGGATLENTVDVSTISAFYGTNDIRNCIDDPIYSLPIIILYIAPSNSISEMYRTFYTVLNNPVVCNGRSYSPTIVSCSWGAPEIAWTQKMPFPPNPSIPVDNSPNPEGIAELNMINDLFAEATKNGINICCASGDIPLSTVNTSVSTYNYAQALLLQGAGAAGFPDGQVVQPQENIFPLTDAARASLPTGQVMFPASSPYVTCVGGSAVYFPSINSGSYDNAQEFAWTRGNGGVSSVFSIPTYQQNQPGSASTSSEQFLKSSLNTANLATAALGIPVPVIDPISGGVTAPNTSVVLATQIKDDVYNNTLDAFNSAKAALESAEAASADDSVFNSLVNTVKVASTALATAESNKKLAHAALEASKDVVVKTQAVSQLLLNLGTVFGACAKTVSFNTNAIQASITPSNDSSSAYITYNALLDAKMAAQTAAYNQLIKPSTANSIALQRANEALQAAQAAADASELAATTLPAAVIQTTKIANDSVKSAANAIIAPSLSTHNYLEGEPKSSPIIPFARDVYNSVKNVNSYLPYDPLSKKPSEFLLNSIGTGYSEVNTELNNTVTNIDNLVTNLVNTIGNTLSFNTTVYQTTNTRNDLAIYTDLLIASAGGHLSDRLVNSSTLPLNSIAREITEILGKKQTEANNWTNRASQQEMLPLTAINYTSALEFAKTAFAISELGSLTISSYQSGNIEQDSVVGTTLVPSINLGYKLPCGLASAAASCMADIYPLTTEELNADIDANTPFGFTDTQGNTVISGAYNGITAPLVNMRNIYANTILATQRMTTAANAAKDAKDAFLVWSAANDLVNTLQETATSLYNTVPTPPADKILKMDTDLVAAKTALSSATYKLGIANNYAVTTARLAQQSAASASACMGNKICGNISGDIQFDQLGNLNAVPSSDNSITIDSSGNNYQGTNNSNCPLISIISGGSSDLQNSLTAAQALIQAAANDTYVLSQDVTYNNHTLSGNDNIGYTIRNYKGARLLVNDAQFAAAGSAAQVANVAFADATELVAKMTDWHNITLAANKAVATTALIYTALQDASQNIVPLDSSGNTPLIQAVNSSIQTVALIIAATTPYNQQSTPSATIATNDVVVLAAKLENLKAVCSASQTAIQLAASTYDSSGSSIAGIANGQGGSIFTINMAYAKVAADAAAAAAVAAAIAAREEATLAARRANFSALALQKLVGKGSIGKAIAGFVDSSGNLVTQTGYGNDSSGTYFPLPKTSGGSGAVNRYVPPAVSARAVIYQGCGGLSYGSNLLGTLQGSSNNQPSLITNLTYNGNSYTNVYAAVQGFVTAAQSVLTSAITDGSGNNSTQVSNTLTQYILYPQVNAVNALNMNLSLTQVNNCLIAAYEAQQWVVASANASFVTFGPSNTDLVSFTPSLIGLVNKLGSDADDCLNTMLNAEGAILSVLSLRPNPLKPHDINSANFAIAFLSNQIAADSYLALTNSAILNEINATTTLHLGDLANSFPPLVANAKIAANQAAALGAMAYADTNPNPGPFNGTSTGPAPFPALNASSSSRPPAPAAVVFQKSAALLESQMFDTTLALASAANNLEVTTSQFNELLVNISTVTPSLVDAANNAARLTLIAAKSANYATNPDVTNPSNTNIFSPETNKIAIELEELYGLILKAQESAGANLEETQDTDGRYNSRKYMLSLWNIAVDAAKEVNKAIINAPVNYPSYYGDPTLITPASLGNITYMGKTNGFDTINPTAPVWIPSIIDQSGNSIVYTINNYASPTPVDSSSSLIPSGSIIKPSLLSFLNAAVINAYNATTGCPDPVTNNYRYLQFDIPELSSRQTNIPENINDTQQAYNNALNALDKLFLIANVKAQSLLEANNAIIAAWNASIAVVSAPNQPSRFPTPVGITAINGGNGSIIYDSSGSQLVKAAVNMVVGADVFVDGNQSAVNLANQTAQSLWQQAATLSAYMCQTDSSGSHYVYSNITLESLFHLMAIVGITFTPVVANDIISSSQANAINLKQIKIITGWALADGSNELWTNYIPTHGLSISTRDGAKNAGYSIEAHPYTSRDWLDLTVSSPLASPFTVGSTTVTIGKWSAFYWTAAISDPSTLAYQTAYTAWKAVLVALNTYASAASESYSSLDTNTAHANIAKVKSIYAMKIALQSAKLANDAAIISSKATALLATGTNSYEDLAASSITNALNASTSNLNFYRCVPDISMHADADDLPVIYRLNGGTVYVGGTSIATAMFAGFISVVNMHNKINYFINTVLYDNYTSPSPLFNKIYGSLQAWYPGSPGGSSVPPRIANILPGKKNPLSGLGSGIYNTNVGLGSINGNNLGGLMEIPELVTLVNPNSSDHQGVVVYPGTSVTLRAYVEPVNAYNPNIIWTTNSPNIYISQTNGPPLSNNGANDTFPYTQYNPMLSNIADSSIGNYTLGSVGNYTLGTNPFHLDSSNNPIPCLVFTATVTGVSQVFSGAALPLVTFTSTDGTNVFGSYSVNVLPPIQVTGVSISSLNEIENPANTTLFLGSTLQLLANVTPTIATNKQVYWWSSNTSIVNVDLSGLLTPLTSGKVTIKVTTINNNISASINVYVPTPITSITVSPYTINLNPNMLVYPLRNTGLLTATIEPQNADYKRVTWEVISSIQLKPSPVGITDVISIPKDGTVLSRSSIFDIIDNTKAIVTSISNGSAIIKVSASGVYGTYTSLINVNVVTPITDIIMTQHEMIINLNPTTTVNPSLPESYKITATLKPAYPTNMNVFWYSSNPKVAIVSNKSTPVLNTVVSDPNFGLWQITEIVTPLSNGTSVITVTTADGEKSDTTTVVVTTPVSGLSMTVIPVILNPSRTYKIQATALPSTATNTSLIWDSTNTSIATVDQNGLVRAITSGSCGISATTVDGDYTAITPISVITNLVGVQIIVNTPLPIHIGDIVQILVVMIPTTTTNQQFTWNVTNSVFSDGPSQNGNIVYLDAVQAGTSIFTVTTSDGNKQASVELIVVNY